MCVSLKSVFCLLNVAAIYVQGQTVDNVTYAVSR